MYNYPFQYGSAPYGSAPMTMEDNSYLTTPKGMAAAFSTATPGMPQLPATKDDKDSELYKKTKGKLDNAVNGAVGNLFGGGGGGGGGGGVGGASLLGGGGEGIASLLGEGAGSLASSGVGSLLGGGGGSELLGALLALI